MGEVRCTICNQPLKEGEEVEITRVVLWAHVGESPEPTYAHRACASAARARGPAKGNVQP